jgi:hypothetical protein
MALTRHRLSKASNRPQIEKIQTELFDMLKSRSGMNITAVIPSLRILIGKDYSFLGQLSLLTTKASFELIEKTYDMLLDSDSPRVTRSLGWFVGIGLAFLDEKKLIQFMGNTKDPNDFSRLNPEKSFLRASFEQLEAQNMFLLDVFHGTKATLPLANWSFLSTVGHEYQMKVFEFCSGQVDGKCASSLISIFVDIFKAFVTNAKKNKDSMVVVCSELGVGKFMEIAGFGDFDFPLITNSVFSTILGDLLNLLCSSGNDLLAIDGLKQIDTKLQISTKNRKTYEHLCEIVLNIYNEFNDTVQSDYSSQKLQLLIGYLRFSIHSQDLVLEINDLTPKGIWTIFTISNSRKDLITTCYERLHKASKININPSSFYCVLATSKMSLDREDRLKIVSKGLDICIMALAEGLGTIVKFSWDYLVLMINYLSCESLETYTPNKLLDWSVISYAALDYFLESIEIVDESKAYRDFVTRLKTLKQRVGEDSAVYKQLKSVGFSNNVVERSRF